MELIVREDAPDAICAFDCKSTCIVAVYEERRIVRRLVCDVSDSRVAMLMAQTRQTRTYFSTITLPSGPCNNSNVAGSASCPNDRTMLRLEVDAVLFRACVHAALRATRRKIGANIVRFRVARGAVVEDEPLSFT